MEHNGHEVLDAFLAIAEITSLQFDHVCRTKISTWWQAIYDKLVELGICKKPSVRIQFRETYKGATVLEPISGLYYNVIVDDAQSLYPTVAILFNLSFDTINCECCVGDKDANIINLPFYEYAKDCIYVNRDTDWICKRRIGAFKNRLSVFKEERLKQKVLGNKSKQMALKILINGGYGIFGHHQNNYPYYDPRVAELVTAAGRYMLSQMQDTAHRDYGFDIIYGDTDSIFLSNTTEKSLEEFKKKIYELYKIDLEKTRSYDKLLLGKNKKRYVGLTGQVIEIVGFDAIKSSTCQYFKDVYEKLIDNCMRTVTDPLPDIRKAFQDIDNVKPELLLISQVLNKNPEEVEGDNQMYAVARAVGANKGEAVKYYKADEDKIGKSWTCNPSELNIWKYKEMLWNMVSEILQIAGYSITELAQELGIGLKKDNCTAKENCGVSKKQRLLELPDYDIGSNEQNTSIGGDR
jgi:DNA polymerase elongation subunit (family B)